MGWLILVVVGLWYAYRWWTKKLGENLSDIIYYSIHKYDEDERKFK